MLKLTTGFILRSALIAMGIFLLMASPVFAQTLKGILTQGECHILILISLGGIFLIIGTILAYFWNLSLNYQIKLKEQQLASREEEAKLARDYLDALINSTADLAIFSVGPKGLIEYYNEGGRRLFGYESAELVGRADLSVFLSEPDRKTLAENLLKKIDPSLGYETEIDLQKKDGQVFRAVLSLSQIKDKRKKLAGYLGIIQDVTERRRLEIDLLERHRELTIINTIMGVINRSTDLTEILNACLDKILEVTGLQGGCVWLLAEDRRDLFLRATVGAHREEMVSLIESPSAALLKAIDSDEPVIWERPGQIPTELVGALPCLSDRMSRAGIMLSMWSHDKAVAVMCLSANEEHHWRREELNFLKVVAEELGVAVANVQLYEKEKQSAALLRAIKDLLERKNQELETFIYSVSHDLRSPLVAMRGFIEALLKEHSGQMDEIGRFYLDRVSNNLSLAELLISDLLEMSRRGRLLEKFQPVSLDEIVRDVIREMDYQIKTGQAELICQDHWPEIFGDRDRLWRVFRNLIDNALKYKGRPAPKIELGWQEQPQEWWFYVRDNGLGIAEAELVKIRDYLERGEGLPDFKTSGTGLGLLSAKKIISAHSGRVWLEAKSGSGTTVFFSLPKMRQE